MELSGPDVQKIDPAKQKNTTADEEVVRAAPAEVPRVGDSILMPPDGDAEAPAAEAPAEKGEGGDTPCRECGTRNPLVFAFCGGCGAALHPSAAAPQPRRSTPQPQRLFATLSLIKPDGSTGEVCPLHTPGVQIGRDHSALFASDHYLSPKHAYFEPDNEGKDSEKQVLVSDLDSLNGVFARIKEPIALVGGDIFRVGQELLRFDGIGAAAPTADGTEIAGSPNPGYWGRLSLLLDTGQCNAVFPLSGSEMLIGRERGDILFSGDGYVSSTHARIFTQQTTVVDGSGDSVWLEDLGSSNGTFIRITAPWRLKSGDFFLIGQQLFRISIE